MLRNSRHNGVINSKDNKTSKNQSFIEWCHMVSYRIMTPYIELNQVVKSTCHRKIGVYTKGTRIELFHNLCIPLYDTIFYIYFFIYIINIIKLNGVITFI
jgi:hypothetical protein